MIEAFEFEKFVMDFVASSASSFAVVALYM